MIDWTPVINDIEAKTAAPFKLESEQSISGGSINSAFCLRSSDRQYFVKTNRSGLLPMFEAEAKGLSTMAESHTIRVPGVVCYGECSNYSYIVLEHLSLTGDIDQALLGRQLAALHQTEAKHVETKPIEAKPFGWVIDNTIGATPQLNAPSEKWADFWQQQRLGYQLDLAAQKGHNGTLQSLGERLQQKTALILEQRDIRPSMLHGDLWSGNVAALSGGIPVIFDPAFYYGDRETDLAMTYLFGGFTDGFYRAYNDAYPLDDGFALRKTYYNIYHIVNHLNLFGGGYYDQAVRMMKLVLSEVE